MIRLLSVTVVAVVMSALQSGEIPWAANGRDVEGTRYSPASEITRENVGRLERAWLYRTGETDTRFATTKPTSFEVTPLVVDGTMYVGTALGRVIALDPGNGVERWVRRRGGEHARVGSFSYAPIRDAAQNILGAVVTVRDVTDRLRLEQQLKASHADLARLMAAQQNVEEAERRRIARELHDELQQVLAAIKIHIGTIEATLARDPAQVAPIVNRIDDLATAAITSSRRIVNASRVSLSREAVGSSSSSSSRGRIKARARFTFCCSPPEKVVGYADQSAGLRLNNSSSVSADFLALPNGTPIESSGSATSSLAVTRGRGRRNWVTKPISSRRSRAMSTSAARARSTVP